jgi:hypothetical protein
MNTIFALQELRDMGDTPDKVAAYLKAQHITGQRGKPSSCPIANYFTSKYGGFCGASRYNLYFTDANSDLNTQVVLPPAVSSFVGRFDYGSYPELESK